MKVLIACEYSGVVRDAFTKRGHDATSCDFLPSDSPNGKHYQGNMFDLIYPQNVYDWDLIIAHPPCTHLSVSGASRWAEKVKDGRQPAAIRFVERIWDLYDKAWFKPIKLCIENPVGALSTRSKLGKATQYIQPYQFGHSEQKKTGLWLRGLPKLKPTNEVDVSGLPDKVRQRLHYLPPSKDRWKLRSTTYQGIADAMAEQWG